MRSEMLPCDRCGRLVAIRSKGLCPACRSMDMPRKERKPMRGGRRPKGVGLAPFFNTHLSFLEGVRKSITGSPIPYPTVSNVCHLYPKRRYRSVAENDKNIVYLTIDEHTRFDYLLDTMDFDRLLDEFGGIWLAIARRMMDLAPEVKEQGKLKISLISWIKENNRYF